MTVATTVSYGLGRDAKIEWIHGTHFEEVNFDGQQVKLEDLVKAKEHLDKYILYHFSPQG
ncbi:hypothetical protein H4R35_002252, partial [Dimargaris xerosporica]